MSWLVAILLALICFAAFVLVFRVPSRSWSPILAMLAVGLAGYGLQASPGLKGAPKAGAEELAGEGDRVVALRKQLVSDEDRSNSDFIVTSDALMRHGQYDNAANLLTSVVEKNPRDGEAWLAMANALTFHANGALTPAALLAYRNAAEVSPRGAGPAFFVGLALIRQGRLIEGRQLWASQLQQMPPGTPGRDILAQRLTDLDGLLSKIAGPKSSPAP